ncbi:MAG: UDP-N-acetylmuramoyl-tripeptide--D-alanyl-D-alanine ligase [Gammaproteobacteria bacterium]|nr:MAG: UDP-N-acetylmuramoyl-tripeptide--D-alanyl-D-alanine ligase [Gammaproteobacteria bacterium]
MISMRLSEAAQLLGGRLHGRDARFSRVSSDSRTLATGELFVALVGPHFDAHDYLPVAAQRGAVAAMVQRPVETPMPTVQVPDTRRALGELAQAWRQRAPARIVAVTGSNGKTTVKEMLAAILSRSHSVLATRGNLNNEIGMPLTLLRLQDEAFGVIEMGANRPGEIGYLSRIARPDVAVLNNAGRAHLEGFGSVRGVARAKAEILEGLAEGGTFVFNADDPHAGLWRKLAAGRSLLGFGLDATADVRSPPESLHIERIGDRFETRFDVEHAGGRFELRLSLAGAHNRMNALAATAAALALGVSPDDVKAGLASMRPVKGRLCPVPAASGALLLDDSYNANPDSVAAAVAVLAALPGRRTLVLGDLGELGPEQERLHAELGELAGRAGIERLVTCGQLSRHAGERFPGDWRHFDEWEAVVRHLEQVVEPKDALLVKGSRASAMDRVVRSLAAEETLC